MLDTSKWTANDWLKAYSEGAIPACISVANLVLYPEYIQDANTGNKITIEEFGTETVDQICRLIMSGDVKKIEITLRVPVDISNIELNLNLSSDPGRPVDSPKDLG